MARIVKDPDVRRNEILDVAQKLFSLKGYEQTAIRDIIDEVGIAKGTFYHYFGSKLDLLDAMIERMLDHRLQTLRPLVLDDQLSAPEKLERFYRDIADWKVENNSFFLDFMAVWYKDENAILRHKVKTASLKITLPLLTQIIEQGIAEGIFATEYPADIAEIILQIGQPFSDTLVKIIVDKAYDEDTLTIIDRKRVVFHHAIERILNAPSGSITLFDLDQVKPWLDGMATRLDAQ